MKKGIRNLFVFEIGKGNSHGDDGARIVIGKVEALADFTPAHGEHDRARLSSLQRLSPDGRVKFLHHVFKDVLVAECVPRLLEDYFTGLEMRDHARLIPPLQELVHDGVRREEAQHAFRDGLTNFQHLQKRQTSFCFISYLTIIL